MKTLLFKSTVGLLLFAGGLAVAHAGGIQLRYAFQKGKAYKYRTRLELFNDAPQGGNAASNKPSAEISMGVELFADGNSSMRDQKWKFVVDTIGMRVSTPEGDDRVVTLERLKGKSLHVDINDRGVPKNVRADDPSTLHQSREFGFELFSRDLLSVMLLFPEYPEDSIETNQPWRFSWTDTTSRNGQQVVVTRSTECKIVGTVSIGKQMCQKIAFTVITRVRSQSVKGETTATGMLYCSDQGIPVKSEASIKVVFSTGGAETIQRRTLSTILQ